MLLGGRSQLCPVARPECHVKTGKAMHHVFGQLEGYGCDVCYWLLYNKIAVICGEEDLLEHNSP